MVLLVLLAAPAPAQDGDDPFDRLRRAKSIRCELDRGTYGSWERGGLKLEPERFGEGGKVTFDSIDTNAGKARLIGSIGAVDVRAILTETGLTFIEATQVGNLNFTTIFATYDTLESRRFVAVSSRHVAIEKSPSPSQYHGTCFVLE
jgi:hypothetical protein